MNELKEKLGLNHYEVYPIDIGRSASQVYKVVGEEETLYLKIGDSDVKNLTTILQFLMDKGLNTPQVRAAGLYNGQRYVLMSECIGTMMHDLDPEVAVKGLAKGLKAIHCMPTDGCSILKDKKYFLDYTLKRKKNHLTPDEQALFETVKKSSLDDQLVFTHGDYCLPNILDQDGTLSFIDFDHGGVSFPAIDLMDCMWSIHYNFKDMKYVDMFLEEYGASEEDLLHLDAIRALYKLLGYNILE